MGTSKIKFYPRLLEPPKRGSFFLFGPRGTGKSTWVRQFCKVTRTVDLLDESLYQELLAQPALFRQQLLDLPRGAWVSADEIQRLPSLLNEVHRLIEEKCLQFILTGSSARKLRKTGVNLLGGRAIMKKMYPLSPTEMGKDFDLSHALRFGTLPIVVHSENPDETLQAYVQMYLKEEIQAEALVKNLGGFSRFIPVSALMHGQVLNISNIANDAGVKRTTVTGFFEILEDTLLAYRLPAFEAGLKVREKKHPKFYWIDPGLARAARRSRGPVSADEAGPLFEGFIFMLLCLQRDTFGDIDDLSYWASLEAKHIEVDFLVTRNREKLAIEVKHTGRLRNEHFAGLRGIAGLKGLKRKILVYSGDRKLLTDDGIEVLPFADFVSELTNRNI